MVEHFLIQIGWGILDMAIVIGMIYVAILLERKWFGEAVDEDKVEDGTRR